MARMIIGSVDLGTRPRQRVSDANEADSFRILLVGDFGGRADAGSQKPRRVDLDSIEKFLADCAARVEVPIGTETIAIEPRSLADLHPDRLFQLQTFQTLRDLRARLSNGQTFAASVSELNALTGITPETPPAQPAATTPVSKPETQNEMFERLLGRTPSTPISAGISPVVEGLLRDAVAPHIASANETDQASAIATLDRIIAAKLRAILHAPAFQKIEATWRGLDFLVRRIELDETLQLQVLNLSRAEWARRAVEGTLGQCLSPAPGAAPWNLIVGNFDFGSSATDANQLVAAADVAEALGAPLVAGFNWAEIQAHAAGSAEWQTLRQSDSAQFVCLTAPRFLLRLPYGANTDPLDTFEFEEMNHPPNEACYLWGNSALLCACAVGEAFLENGWNLMVGPGIQISGLPIHIYKEAGETKTTPCAEMWLTDIEAEKLIAAGISPAQPVLGNDTLNLTLVSLASTPLAGNWASAGA